MKAKRPEVPTRGGLTEDQVAELRAHLALRPRLAQNEDEVLWAIRHWFPVTRSALIGEQAEERAWRAEHFAKVAALARELQTALAEDGLFPEKRPLAKTKDLEWASFDQNLERLAVSAGEEAEAARALKLTGRASEKWRDQLVALVDDLYQRREDMTKRVVTGHRQQTIAMLFRFLGVQVRDLKSTLRDARARKVPPPFVLKVGES